MNDELLELTEEEFSLYELLPVCGCGLSASILELYRRVLEVTPPSHASKLADYEWPSWNDRLAAAGGNELLYEVVAHALDHIEATEHGSSVAGAWRTERGDQLLGILDRYAATDYEATPCMSVEPRTTQ